MVATKKEWLASLREEPAKQDRLVLVPRLLAFVGIVLAAFVLFGCAKEEEQQLQVCYMKYPGATAEGYSVVAQTCMSPEAFKKSQEE